MSEEKKAIQEEDFETIRRDLDADTLKERHEYGIDADSDTIYLEGPFEEPDANEVNWWMARRFIKNLNALVHSLVNDAPPGAHLTVDIDSVGGCTEAGMAIFDAIRACPVRTVGLVSGQASSMACVILQACDERVVSPHSKIMFHPGHSGDETSTPEYRSATDLTHAANQLIDDAVYARVRERQPGMTRDEFDLRVMRGIYLIGQQAVDFGLADRVRERPAKLVGERKE